MFPDASAFSSQITVTDHVKMRVTTQKVSSQLGPGTTWAQRGNM